MPLAPAPPIVPQNETVQQTIDLFSPWKIMIGAMETATQLRRVCIRRWLEFSTTSVLFAWYYIPLHNQKKIWLTSISVCRLHLPLTFDVCSHINQWRGNKYRRGTCLLDVSGTSTNVRWDNVTNIIISDVDVGECPTYIWQTIQSILSWQNYNILYYNIDYIVITFRTLWSTM